MILFNSNYNSSSDANQEENGTIKASREISQNDINVIKRIDWVVNEDISEEILKAAETYNK